MSKNLAASGIHAPTQNYLLAALPAADYQRLLPDLELVPLPLGMAVDESGGELNYVYFPTDSIGPSVVDFRDTRNPLQGILR
jgi:hypothetical protein